MAFTGMIDNLAFVEVLLLLGGSILTWLGITGWWAMRTGNVKGLRSQLKSAAVPIGIVGATMFILSLWGEMVWPYGTGMQGYNIFFGDVMVLFGMMMLAFAFTAYYELTFQYLAVFAFVIGGVTAFYGWTGYYATPAYTKDPFTTFLMYEGFAAAGIFALPAGIITDLWLANAEGRSTFWSSVASLHTSAPGIRGMGTRGVGSLTSPDDETPKEDDEKVSKMKYRMPILAQMLVLLFPVFMALATYAAMAYFGSTLTGHLGSGAGKAP